MLVKIEDIKTIKGKRLADKYKLEERRAVSYTHLDVYKRQVMIFS